MNEPPTEYELVRPDAQNWELARRGIDCILAPPTFETTGSDGTLAQRRELFEAYCHEHRIDLGRQILALRKGEVLAACLWVANPGQTALLYFTDLRRRPQAGAPTAACIRAALADARATGVTLAQAIVFADDTASIRVCQEAGLEDLATLDYLHRGRPLFVPRVDWPPEVSVAGYNGANHQLFAQTIQASYEHTLDCPALTGWRRIDEVIAGHKAVGVFDPALWLLALQHQQPVGVLLLARHPARAALEIVYLGIIPAARRQGIGSALLRHALRIMAAEKIDQLILAVDEANAPALKLYRRLHFRITSQRRVLIGAKRVPGGAPTS